MVKNTQAIRRQQPLTMCVPVFFGKLSKMLQDFSSLSDHFEKLCIKGLKPFALSQKMLLRPP